MTSNKVSYQDIYRLLQLTNSSGGATPVNTALPLGIVTRQVAQKSSCQNTFNVGTTASSAVYVNEPGIYKITVTGTVVATAGVVNLQLQTNTTTVFNQTATAAAGASIPISMSFTVRAWNNPLSNSNIPLLVQIVNAANSVALTSFSLNTIIERVQL